MTKRPLLLALSVFTLSIFIISYQIGLMKALEFVSYSHFANLIISIALLGFGTSGTFLSFFRITEKKNTHLFITVLFFLLILSIPFAYLASQRIPLDIQYIFFSFTEAVRFFLRAFCLFIPFFLSAALVGTFLSLYSSSAPLLYGSNLIGSGLGGIAVLFLLILIPPQMLPFRLPGLALLAFLFWIGGEYGRQNSALTRPLRRPELGVPEASRTGPGGKRTIAFPIIAAGAALACTALFFFISPRIKPDQYKAVSYISHLERQDSAEKLWSAYGPEGTLHLYASGSFHDALFAAPNTPAGPPAQLMLLRNGINAGVIFRTDSKKDTAILDYTPQSLAYRMSKKPRVLILDETGGTNIWLARRYNASSITVVQPNADIVRMWKKVLPSFGIPLFKKTDITVINRNPRLFLKTADRKWDIIHIAGAESMPAMHSGLYASQEDYVLTVEGVQECLRLLSSKGCITVTRGLQSPPRDNVKLLSLADAALRGEGIDASDEHILQGKNYLAATTILFQNAPGRETISKYLDHLSDLRMDSEWHPGIRSGEIEQINKIPGPPGKDYSYLHYGAKQIFSGNAEKFFDEYIYAVEPPTDNKPYFNHFFRWRSIDSLSGTLGRYWFQSSEIGYLLLFITFCGITAISFIFILAPVLAGRLRKRRAPPRPDSQKSTAAGHGMFRYLFMFPVIGVGFMFIELVMIHKLGIFLGNPVFSVAAVITSILVFSGVGSVLQGKIRTAPKRRLWIAGAGVIIFLTASLFLFDPFVDFLAGSGLVVRFAAALLFTAPPAFFLGWFFVSGIAAVSSKNPGAVPLAWGLNGFASVAAAPLATILAMWIGYDAVLYAAMGLYAAVALVARSWRIPA